MTKLQKWQEKGGKRIKKTGKLREIKMEQRRQNKKPRNWLNMKLYKKM